MSSELRRTPLYASHRALGARMVPFSGWEMPVQYSGVTDEHSAVRHAVGLFDVSHMGELHVSGPGAAACLDHIVTNDVAKLGEGRALYTVACNERGTILDDLIVYRLSAEHYLVVCNAGNLAKIHAHFAAQTHGRCHFEDRSDATALIAVQGPAAVQLVEKLGGTTLAALPRFGITQAVLAGIAVTTARTGYTGEDGYELFCASEDAAKLWEALLELGQPLGVKPIGLGARDTLRLEAKLALYGNDIDETTSPLEAGLGWVVKLDKPGFIGREALLQQKQQPLARSLVGFEMVGRGIARHGHVICDASGTTVGQVTSGAPGLSLGKNIGLGYVPAHLKSVGTRIDIEIRQQKIEARVCATPFYKRA
ncbi:MAG: glycine cleavage system aminomethyltransferase GcvT [Polyangiales bacterium]